ncbi:DNA-binding protein [Ornithinimicrobium cerasi]|uniref:DNA-binding protein n=1 Tax=Ornithinimicrobium cerasi TaxID=2248773 RepID=UPI000BE2BFDA|nr:DNA-binding protein [Ornithinimicrobium cerasi]
MREEELLTVKQVGTELGMPFTRVRSLISRGRLKAVLMPAGAATSRVSRADLRRYTEEVAREDRDRRRRARDKALGQLTASWDRLSDDERKHLETVLPVEIFRPLADATRPHCVRRPEALKALCTAYGNRTDAGMEELAMDMPPDLLWAVARVRTALREAEEA